MDRPKMKMSMARAINASQSDLRIVLLGKNLSENCRVGNMILGKKVFISEAPPDQVQSQRRTHKNVINVPHLLQPHLSDDQITQTVRECLRMSDPGPHVIVLILQNEQCSAEDLQHVEKVLNYFSSKVFEHTMVLTTQEPDCVVLSEVNHIIKEIIKKCFNKHYRLTQNCSSTDLREKLETFVQTNARRYLLCNKSEHLVGSGKSMEQHIIKVGCKDSPLTFVLFGNSASVQFGQDNFLFGKSRLCFKTTETSRIDPIQREIAECLFSVIDMTDLHEAELYLNTVNHVIDQLVKENEIHSFIFVVRLGQLTDADKTGLEWLQRVFGDKVLQFVLILFTYEKEEERDSITDDLKKNPVLEQLLEKCGGRYHTCNKMMNNQSEMRELIDKIDCLIKENRQCYNEDMYNTKIRQNYPKSKDKVTAREDNTEHITSMKKDTHMEIASVAETRLEEEKGKDMNEKIKHLFYRLDLQCRHHKLKTADVLQLTAHSLQSHESCAEEKLVQIFFHKLLMMNYSARYIIVEENNEQHLIQRRNNDPNEEIRDFFKAMSFSNKETFKSEPIHPMDVQMAAFHCSDGFLKQLMVTKLSQCQFALPLLVPDPETQQIEFPLWTFRQINKSWKIRNTNNETISQTQPIYKAQTPMVFFFRFGSVSSSKSQLMNSLINDKHNTFFHRNCPGSSRSRVLMDGVVEIAWFCPSGKNTDKFSDCVAFCNLHGDAGDHEKQWKMLTEMASVNVLLLQQIDTNNIHAEKIQNLYKNTKPLICLLVEDESALFEQSQGKYKIGLKDRNQSKVSEELMKAITVCLSESSSTFRLEEVSKHSDIRVDEEDDEDCRRGRAAAQQMISLLEEKKLTEIKESFLPHQGKLWHQWSQKNKELHRLRGDEIEIAISRKQSEMEKIREQQHECDMNSMIQFFLKQITDAANRTYFLKWLEIILEECTSSVQRLKTEQIKLERISEDLHAATFGLEHIMREIGQIYESCSSVKENKKDLPVHFSSLPSLAAEMMISGFPLELMDGDAAHVPLVWISAVFDQLVQKLGVQTRVFVLSVLGIQSSGKSTMLNAMFGLQFAVSAGRCTRGAFMQLVKVSDEMERHINFDYILVVDTEGLRALELAGRSSRRHDNELATFVVGLANMTLINIFGENPSEMQDVLQIVVQAFLRMKKVKLDPICVFVHQNVSDITAGEKNEEGRRRLQKTLDRMTKLAAEEEVYDAKCFSDIIRFDVQNNVKYFAQFWEGSPPMAPPNPNYCENIQELKETIITHSSKSDGMILTHFKDRIRDLWKALLNEQFVFSFRNSLEISVYRKLETEYSKWSWSLRSAMLEIENKLHNKIENEAIHKVEETDLQRELKETSEEVKRSMFKFFAKDPDADILIQWKTSFEIKIKDVRENILRETKRKLNGILQQRDMKKKINAQRTQHENTLLKTSKELAIKLKEKTKTNDEETLKKEFDLVWKQCVTKIISDTPAVIDIDIMRDVQEFLRDHYESAPVDHWRESSDILTETNYFQYVLLKKEFKESVNNSSKDTQTFSSDYKIKTLVSDIVDQTDMMIQSFNISKMGFNISRIQQLTDYINTRVKEHAEGPVEYVFKKQFFMDLVVSICKRAKEVVNDQHKKFREANDPEIYIQKKREEYYSIFQKYCLGATSAAIFGQIICQKMNESIEQSIYKKTARDLADEIMKNCESLNGNRSKLEKHILKTLAEEEDFEKYMNYVHNPKDHYKSFIRDEVSRYIRDKFSISVLPKMKENIKLLQQKIMNAAHQSTEHVQVNSGDVGLWLKSFTQQLSDQLIFSEKDLSGVKHDDVDDFTLLEDVIRQELTAVMSDISSRFNTDTFPVKLDYKFRPDELLIDHFCQCCWVQCPFCGATCTNTTEDHPGDHSVSFHLNISLNGIHYHNTTNLSPLICTSAVGNINLHFYPVSSYDKIPWEDYRRAGGVYADWSITPDLSELPYWKWFVCRFQKDLEKKYDKTFEGSGKIPDEWKKYSKQDATKSLDRYI